MSMLTDEEWAVAVERMKVFRDQMVREFGCSSIVIAAACECDVDGETGNSHRITRRGSIYECMGLVKLAEVEMLEDIAVVKDGG